MPDDILVSIERDPLFGRTRTGYIEELKRILAGRVREAYLFGSFTGKRFGKFSDIDIILVTDTHKPFTERSEDFSDVMNIVPTTDILVYTAAEFAGLINDESPGFWRSVRESMVRIL